MRTQMFGLSLVLSGLIGCGGGGGTKSPDAKIFLDAAIDAPAACAIDPKPAGYIIGYMQDGTTPANPVPTGNLVTVPTTGPYMGKTLFRLVGGLPSSTAAAEDLMVFDVLKPDAGQFPVNTAINWDPNAAAAAPVAASYILGDVDDAAMTIGNFYYASNGSITFSAIGTTQGAAITGAVAATMFREIDEQNADIPGGCLASLTGFKMNMINMAPPFQQGQQDTGDVKMFSAEKLKRISDMIDARMAR